MDEDIEEELNRLNISYDIYKRPINRFIMMDEAFLEDFRIYLQDKSYDAVLCVDYAPPLSLACHEKGIPYICWSYDAPMGIGKLEYFDFPTTFVFTFEGNECTIYKKLAKHAHIFHLPLAVNTRRYDKVWLKQEEWELYESDISFIGSLYENPLASMGDFLTDFDKAYLNALVDVQLDTYGKDIITPALSDMFAVDLLSRINCAKFWNRMEGGYMKSNEGGSEKKKMVPPGTIQTLLMRHVANRERVTLLELLGKRYHTRLYSYNDSTVLKNVEKYGTVHWKIEAPMVFKASKINLNISLRTIATGIPMRCLDIMGCGGFLLSNYQEDLAELVPRDACAMYGSMEEAAELADFYMRNEKERKAVAFRGYIAMKENFTYARRFRTMFEAVGLKGVKYDR
ncbi:MAG: glycosyltransferase [Lachnospiraceae bacterium]|nr:glycosyltransferase [Lachnospiraceae bacterium]